MAETRRLASEVVKGIGDSEQESIRAFHAMKILGVSQKSACSRNTVIQGNDSRFREKEPAIPRFQFQKGNPLRMELPRSSRNGIKEWLTECISASILFVRVLETCSGFLGNDNCQERFESSQNMIAIPENFCLTSAEDMRKWGIVRTF
jgi:hypothetical protein